MWHHALPVQQIGRRMMPHNLPETETETQINVARPCFKISHVLVMFIALKLSSEGGM